MNEQLDVAQQAEMTPDEGAHVFTGFYRNMFGLSNWAVNVKTEEDFKAYGHLRYEYQAQTAYVTFERNQSIESMEENAAHEMLHLAMARIENLFYQATRHMPTKPYEILRNLFIDECEALVVVVANAIVNLRRGEYKGPAPSCPYCNTSRIGYAHQLKE